VKIYCDVHGTSRGNIAGHSDAACAEALCQLQSAGHDVRPCSSDASLGYEDKLDVLSGDLVGVVLIDDDRRILATAVRKGAIVVPAERLLEFAAMVGAR
jgi:hypothetical protein